LTSGPPFSFPYSPAVVSFSLPIHLQTQFGVVLPRSRRFELRLSFSTQQVRQIVCSHTSLCGRLAAQLDRSCCPTRTVHPPALLAISTRRSSSTAMHAQTRLCTSAAVLTAVGRAERPATDFSSPAGRAAPAAAFRAEAGLLAFENSSRPPLSR